MFIATPTQRGGGEPFRSGTPRRGKMADVNDAPRIRLDSRLPGARWACRPAEPMLVLECENPSRVALLRSRDEIIRMWDEPLAALDWMAEHLAEVAADDGGGGGSAGGARWIGYLSYDLARLLDDAPPAERAVDDLQLPLFAFTLHHVPADLPWAARSREARANATLSSNFSADGFAEAVAAAVDAMAAGDLERVHLAQRFTAALTEPPARIYDRLRRASPARFGAYLDHLDYALICNADELLVKVAPVDGAAGAAGTAGRRTITRPAGHERAAASGGALRVRDVDAERSEIERVTDAERGALAGICEPGSVRVRRREGIEGTLRGDVRFVELLRATFPGSSVTGRPRRAAMEVIEALEPHRRGPYGGAIGYLAAGGAMEFNVATRTMLVRDGLVHVATGATIDARTDPPAAYAETVVTAQPMLAALGIT